MQNFNPQFIFWIRDRMDVVNKTWHIDKKQECRVPEKLVTIESLSSDQYP